MGIIAGRPAMGSDPLPAAAAAGAARFIRGVANENDATEIADAAMSPGRFSSGDPPATHPASTREP